MITRELNLIIAALIALVALASISYNYKLVFDEKLQNQKQLLIHLSEYELKPLLMQNNADTAPLEAAFARHRQMFDVPLFVLFEASGSVTALGGYEPSFSQKTPLDLGGLENAGYEYRVLTAGGTDRRLVIGFARSDIFKATRSVLYSTVVFVAIALLFYVLAVFAYVRARLERPLETLLKGRLRGVINDVILGTDEFTAKGPIPHLPKTLGVHIENIFSVLSNWGRYKRNFEEFMAITVSETSKAALAKSFYNAVRKDFFVKHLLILETNHSANRMELVYSSDDRVVLDEALFSDPKGCLVYRTGARITQSCDRMFCGLCGELAECDVVLCKPLVAGAQQVGICRLVLDADAIRADLNVAESFEKKIQFLEAHLKLYTDYLALTLSNINLQSAYKNQALTDELTGLYNRRYIVEYFENILNIAKRKETPVAVMMIDIDNFKRFNDEYGHKTGDQVLRVVAQTLQASVREGDSVGRYGGEEFIVLFPHTDIDDAARIADRIRDAVAQTEWNLQGMPSLPKLTISAGLAYFPEHGYSHYHLTNAADKALYRAKREGKNRIVVHSLPKDRAEDL